MAYAGIIDAELFDSAAAAWASGDEPTPYRSGATNVRTGLGGVRELRYVRDL